MPLLTLKCNQEGAPLALQFSDPEPLAQSVIAPVAVNGEWSLRGPRVNVPGVAQLRLGGVGVVPGCCDVGVAPMVGVATGVSVVPVVSVGEGVGTGVLPSCTMVKFSDALRCVTDSLAWTVCFPGFHEGSTKKEILKEPSP